MGQAEQVDAGEHTHNPDVLTVVQVCRGPSVRCFTARIQGREPLSGQGVDCLKDLQNALWK